jgi:hypothetical protein
MEIRGWHHDSCQYSWNSKVNWCLIIHQLVPIDRIIPIHVSLRCVILNVFCNHISLSLIYSDWGFFIILVSLFIKFNRSKPGVCAYVCTVPNWYSDVFCHNLWLSFLGLIAATCHTWFLFYQFYCPLFDKMIVHYCYIWCRIAWNLVVTDWPSPTSVCVVVSQNLKKHTWECQETQWNFVISVMS